MKIILTLLICLGTACGQGQVETVAGEPANLGPAKQALVRYHDCVESDCYGPQMERQSELALGFLRASAAGAKPGEKLAVVLDIDETALANWVVERHDDFGYIPQDWNWCVTLRCGTAIAGTLRVFREAERDRVAVFFISGRPETQRADTIANLESVGYVGFQGLALRPADRSAGQTTTEFKSGERGKIVAAGYRIVLNVGDQMSDLNGLYAGEHSVKLPNPFYYIP